MRHMGRKQGGAALIMVILMVALMTVLAVGLVDSVRYNSQRLLNQRLMDQAYWYALGGEQIAKFALKDAVEDATINLSQVWARRDTLFPIDGGSIAGYIEDQQACFNVNNLYQVNAEAEPGAVITEAASLTVLRGLLLNLDLSPERADFIADRVNDWIDEDFGPEGVYGAEDLYYSDQDFPYMPPNQVMVSPSEMNLLAEFEEGEWQALSPFLCALPEVNTPININTLLPEHAALLAAAIGNTVSVEQVRAVLNARPEDGWPDVATFISELALPLEQQPSTELLQGLAVQSKYFRGLADIFYQQRQLKMYSRFVIKGGKAVAYAREYGEVF